jgi:hypothetical protein
LTCIQISLPEILACGACALFIVGAPITGSVFLFLSVAMGILRLSLKMQEMKQHQENFAVIIQLVSGVGNYLDGFLQSAIFAAQRHSHDHDDEDPSNYN